MEDFFGTCKAGDLVGPRREYLERVAGGGEKRV